MTRVPFFIIRQLFEKNRRNTINRRITRTYPMLQKMVCQVRFVSKYLKKFIASVFLKLFDLKKKSFFFYNLILYSKMIRKYMKRLEIFRRIWKYTPFWVICLGSVQKICHANFSSFHHDRPQRYVPVIFLDTYRHIWLRTSDPPGASRIFWTLPNYFS